MNYFVETIKVATDGTANSTIDKYADELTATIFYHSKLNTELRLVQSGSLKSVYANIHTDGGVTIRQERWAVPEEESVEPEEESVEPEGE